MSNDDPSNEIDAIKVDFRSVIWHLIDSNSILCSLHDTNPTFCRHDIEKSHHGITYIVEVLILVDPVPTVIKAIKFVFYMSLKYFRNIIIMANKEYSFVKVSTQNSEKHNKKTSDDHYISNVGNSIDQGLHSNS
jgi:hypothetical protein